MPAPPPLSLPATVRAMGMVLESKEGFSIGTTIQVLHTLTASEHGYRAGTGLNPSKTRNSMRSFPTPVLTGSGYTGISQLDIKHPDKTIMGRPANRPDQTPQAV